MVFAGMGDDIVDQRIGFRYVPPWPLNKQSHLPQWLAGKEHEYIKLDGRISQSRPPS